MAATANTIELEGRVCAVTGAASGIGRAIAVMLARHGGKVAVLDRNEAGARETGQLIAASGGTGLVVPCDVSSRDSVEAACRTVTRDLGDAAVLVNNAAILKPGPLATLSLDDWNAQIAVNLTGYLSCAQVFGKAMRENKAGSLIHVTSVMANFARANGGAYSVAKAAVSMLSRQLAVEWGPDGVRSNAVLPGLVITPLSQANYDRPEFLRRREETVPMRRIAQPEDIARAVLYLASPLSDYVSGSEISPDGAFAVNLVNLVPRV